MRMCRVGSRVLGRLLSRRRMFVDLRSHCRYLIELGRVYDILARKGRKGRKGVWSHSIRNDHVKVAQKEKTSTHSGVMKLLFIAKSPHLMSSWEPGHEVLVSLPMVSSIVHEILHLKVLS